MSLLVGCDAAGCAERLTVRTPADAGAQLAPSEGWVELRRQDPQLRDECAARYDLCPAHAALLSDDQWRARLDEAPAALDDRAKELLAAHDGEPSVTHVTLACGDPGDPHSAARCGYPARDHCAPHNPRHCPGGCSG